MRVLSSESRILVGLLLAAPLSWAQAQQYELMAGDAGVAFHYPGPDGRVGTADDVVSSQLTTIVGSDPNVPGAYSFAAFEAFVADPALPGNNTAVAFAQGSLTLDPAVASAGGGPLITGGMARGTGFGQGLGTGTLEILTVNGGSYDPGTGALSLNVDIEATVAGITRQVTGGQLTGSAIILDAAEFGAGSGNAYVDNVLIPRALALNADGLVFVELQGQAPLDPPWIIIPAPFTVVLAAVKGVPAAEQANLALGKSVPAGPFATGDTFSFPLTITNNGPGVSNGVTVHDLLPTGLDWVSDDCGAGPPAAGRLTWSVGTLANGASANCQVTVMANPQAAAKQTNAAVAVSATSDPDLSDNVAAAPVAIVQPAAVEGLVQSPDQGTGFPSDASCNACPLGVQVVADNFKVENQLSLDQISFYGGYTDNQAIADQFVIKVRENLAVSSQPGVPGVPGALLMSFSAPVNRVATGALVAGFFNEYQYTMDVSADLGRGIYWIAIYNDSGSSAGDWFWETGQADAGLRSLPTVAANLTLPPHPRWSPNPAVQMAVNLTAGQATASTQVIPTLNLAGLVALLLVLGLMVRQRLLHHS